MDEYNILRVKLTHILIRSRTLALELDDLSQEQIIKRQAIIYKRMSRAFDFAYSDLNALYDIKAATIMTNFLNDLRDSFIQIDNSIHRDKHNALDI